MAGLTKEEIFYFTDTTDQPDFTNDVVSALGRPLEIRADDIHAGFRRWV